MLKRSKLWLDQLNKSTNTQLREMYEMVWCHIFSVRLFNDPPNCVYYYNYMSRYFVISNHLVSKIISLELQRMIFSVL